MTPEGAYLVIGAGMAVAGVIWIICLRLLLRQRGWPRQETGRWELPALTPDVAIGRALYLVAAHTRVRRQHDDGLLIALGGCLARLRFTTVEQGGALRMVATLDWSRGARMFDFLVGLLVLVVQPAVILGIGGGLWHWIASDAADEVRRSAWQVVQVAHVLWPPFLVHVIYRHLRRQARAVIDQLVHELRSDPSGWETPDTG
jgi:ABC-type spermidine/putrescine transport system permease subunit II